MEFRPSTSNRNQVSLFQLTKQRKVIESLDLLESTLKNDSPLRPNTRRDAAKKLSQNKPNLPPPRWFGGWGRWPNTRTTSHQKNRESYGKNEKYEDPRSKDGSPGARTALQTSCSLALGEPLRRGSIHAVSNATPDYHKPGPLSQQAVAKERCDNSDNRLEEAKANCDNPVPAASQYGARKNERIT